MSRIITCSICICLLFLTSCQDSTLTDAPLRDSITIASGTDGVILSKKAPKVTICHATSSETNPWVVINISENALAAHLEHGDETATEGQDPSDCGCTSDGDGTNTGGDSGGDGINTGGDLGGGGGLNTGGDTPVGSDPGCPGP